VLGEEEAILLEFWIPALDSGKERWRWRRIVVKELKLKKDFGGSGGPTQVVVRRGGGGAASAVGDQWVRPEGVEEEERGWKGWRKKNDAAEEKRVRKTNNEEIVHLPYNMTGHTIRQS
jgi:hypothetical protein